MVGCGVGCGRVSGVYLFGCECMFKFKIVDYSLAMASQLALTACSHVDHSVFTNLHVLGTLHLHGKMYVR
jgi:hypothetical protein